MERFKIYLEKKKIFTIIFIPLLAGSFLFATQGVTQKRVTLAYYYLWYQTQYPNWENLVKTTPLLGYYSSTDDNIIKQHIQWAKEAGIDGFIISDWGRTNLQSSTYPYTIEVLEKNKFYYCLLIEAGSPDFNMKDKVLAEVRYIRDSFSQNPYYLKADRKPVLMIFDYTQKWRGIGLPTIAFWGDIKNNFPEFSYWFCTGEADIKNVDDLSTVFDLVDCYVPLLFRLPSQYFSSGGLVAEGNLQTGAYISQRQEWDKLTKYSSTTIMFQFDKSKWDKQHGFSQSIIIPYYANTISQFNNGLQKNYLLITSWNEFIENTNIEPTIQHGSKFLDLIKNWLTPTL